MRGASFCMIVGLVLLTGCNGEEKTARGPGDNKLTLEVPDAVVVKQGQAEEFEIEIEREGFNGAVELEFSGEPKGVDIVGEKRIAQDREEAKLLFKATADAEPRRSMIKVTAKGGGVTVTQNFPITVRTGEEKREE